MADDLLTNPDAATSPTVSTIGSESVHEFIRYFVASALALIADIGCLWLLTSVVGVPYLLSGALSFGLGIVIVYVLSTRWVFTRRILSNPHLEFLIFALVGLVGLGLNELVLWILTGLLSVFYLVSKLVSVVIVFTWNFAARKWLLFRTHA